MKNKTLKNKKKYGGMLSQGSQKQGSKPKGSKPHGSKPHGSQKHGSKTKPVFIKPSFEEELKAYCMNNFIGSNNIYDDYIYDEYTEILPGIYKDDTTKRNTMYLLIFIISMLNAMLKDKCKIIIKGGLAVLFAVSSHQEPIPYSTKDIDLLIQPLDGNDGLFHAQFIGDMIMWIFDGIDKKIDKKRFNKLSLLYDPEIVMKEKQIIKISMINVPDPEPEPGPVPVPGPVNFTAAMDININLPDELFYSPIVEHHINTYNEDGFSTIFFHENKPVLFFVSKKALIFDRMLHLIKYYFANTERSSTHELTDKQLDEMYNTIKNNKFYLASIKKSLNALILEHIVSHTKTSKLRESVLKLSAIPSKSKEDVFYQFLDDTITASNIELTTEQRTKLKRYILS
jgi:hypothetical protein